MIKEALQYLLSLRDVEQFQLNGHQYTNKQLVQVSEDEPSIFSTKTLASLVELIVKERNHERLDDLIVHVESPTKVNVITTLRGDFGRYNLYSAVAELPRIALDNYMDLEAMNILLKSAFVSSDMRDKLVQILGNVKEEVVKTSSDDGISQSVVAKVGIGTVGNVKLPPVVSLAPYRTFLEIEQPEGEFLLRLKNGPLAALFEADGGAWKIDARKSIKQYFETALADLIEQGKVVVTE